MPTAERGTTTKRETWADWFPDADTDTQGTVDDLMDFLRRIGAKEVSADNIRYWQKAGIIPSPIKRWHDGATRAIYPTTYAALVIRELLQLKELGYTLHQIAPRIRAYAATMRNPDTLGIREAITHVAREYERITLNTITGVRMRFFDADGRFHDHHYDIPPDRSDDTQR